MNENNVSTEEKVPKAKVKKVRKEREVFASESELRAHAPPTNGKGDAKKGFKLTDEDGEELGYTYAFNADEAILTQNKKTPKILAIPLDKGMGNLTLDRMLAELAKAGVSLTPEQKAQWKGSVADRPPEQKALESRVNASGHLPTNTPTAGQGKVVTPSKKDREHQKA